MLSSKTPVLYHPTKHDTHSSRKLAVITGASSGIGKAYAEFFAASKYDLLITGRRKDVIQQVAGNLKERYHVNVDVVIADLAKDCDLSLLLQNLGKRKNIEVLVNNAGFGLDTRFSEDELDHQMAMLKVHVNAPVMLIKKVLPVMIGNHSGTIINVSSLAAFLPTPSNSMYTGTKSFLWSFTESLYLDVSTMGIQVQCLCPGFTDSDFHRNHDRPGDGVKQTFLRGMEPMAVVEYSMRCLTKGQVICVPGFTNRIMSVLAPLVPRSFYYWMAVKMDRKFREYYPVFNLACMQHVQGET